MASGKQITERIDELCAKQKISRIKLTEDLQLDVNMSNWKSRDTVPRADTAIQIARYFGVSVEYLITGEDTKNEKFRGILKDIEALSDDKLQELISFLQFLRQRS